MAHSQQVLVEVARETGNDLPVTRTRPAGDPKALRGIPVCGVPGGIGGTMAETNPLAALLRKEDVLERQRARRGEEVVALLAREAAADGEMG